MEQLISVLVPDHTATYIAPRPVPGHREEGAFPKETRHENGCCDRIPE